MPQDLREEVPDLFICDWSNIVHRAFHGLGGYGDLYALDIVKMAQNITIETAIHHCFVGARIAYVMDGGYSGRKQIYPEYKANRTETTDRPVGLTVALTAEFPKSLFLEWRGTPVRVHGFESDDVMIALAREQVRRGGKAFIFSNDGDMHQAVQDGITVLRPRKYPDPPEIYDYEKVVQEYGFTPDYIPHYKALKGDTADNIPTVPRVGHGTACKLIARYGTIQGVIRAAVDEALTPVVSRNIREYRETIFLNFRLVTPVTVPGIPKVYDTIMAGNPAIV